LRRSLTRLQFLSVILDLYLDAIGLGTTVIAWIFTAVLTGGAVVTILITTAADTFGRKQVLIQGALLMALAGCVFALTSNPLVLTRAAVFGTISLSGKEVGPFLYQASDSATDESRSSQDESFLRLQSCRLNLWSIRSAWLWCIQRSVPLLLAFLSVSHNTGAGIAPLLRHLFGQSGIRAAVSIGWCFEDCFTTCGSSRFPEFATP
jgi:MFS family permease